MAFTRSSLVVSIVLTVRVGAAAQEPAVDASRESQVKARVEALMQRSRQGNADDVAWEEVRDEVDTLLSAVTSADQPRRAEDSLRRLLAGHEPNPEDSRRPVARMADLRHGRSVVAAYVIIRGPHHDVAVIRGFAETSDGRFQPVASLTEFEGHNLFLEELPAPLEGESWFIGWGRAHGADGSTARVRVFSFDGAQFRVLWSPPDMNRVSVRVTDQGFDLTYQTADVNPPAFVTDEFVLTPAGPDRVESSIHDAEPIKDN